MRDPRGEEAQPAGGCRGDGELRDRARHRRVRARRTDDAGGRVAAVEQAGYEAILPTAKPDAHVPHDPVDALRRRLVFAAVATVPLLALGMIPPLQFDSWQWISLQLATPVLVWAALPFHRAAWTNLRHGTATMDTLISIGTIAAWTWWVISLLFLGAGDPGMRHALSFVPERGGPTGDVYFEAVGVVVTFLLAGRWFEASFLEVPVNGSVFYYLRKVPYLSLPA